MWFKILLALAICAVDAARIDKVQQEKIPNLPPEILEELSSSDTHMRHLLAGATTSVSTTSAAGNSSNITCKAGAPWNPSCPPLKLVGQSNVCVSKAEYIGTATQDPNSPQYTDGTFFCAGYVDYAAACDMNNNQSSCNNVWAYQMYENFVRALNVYSCKSFSQIWVCDDCKAAYKRWLCSQVYRKFYIPDTGYYEEGVLPESSRLCTCDPAQTDEPCKRFCNGMPNNCFVNADKLWECKATACGQTPGACQGNVVLDGNASTTTGFYVGAKIEITSSSGGAAGQWALIENYYAFTHTSNGKKKLSAAGIALFSKWNLPYGSTAKIAMPQEGDTYRIYYEDSHRGFCRLSARPQIRKGLPCQIRKQFQPLEALYDPDESANYESTIDKSITTQAGFRNMAYCGEDRQCVNVPTSISSSGYMCCPNSGMTTIPIEPGQQFWISFLNISNPMNPTCAYAVGPNFTVATSGIGVQDTSSTMVPAVKALTAVQSSGCTYNFTATVDKASDNCMLTTCQPVCFDVLRRCPPELEFGCPDVFDNREYDAAICNMMVDHGCTISVTNQTYLDKRCAHLNPVGYGAMNDPLEKQDGGWFMGKEIFGLPAYPSCRNFSSQMAIDIGFRNPPAAGPTNLLAKPYPVWCAGDNVGMSFTQHGQGTGCIEMRYMGPYMWWCPQKWDTNWNGYYTSHGKAAVST